MIPTAGKSRFRFMLPELFIPISLLLLEIAWRVPICLVENA
jgi:hypothetical protein